jgi:hypothetical protein
MVGGMDGLLALFGLYLIWRDNWADPLYLQALV